MDTPRSRWRAYETDDLPEIRELFGWGDGGFSSAALQLLDDSADGTWDAIVAVGEDNEVVALAMVALLDAANSHCVGRSFVSDRLRGTVPWSDVLAWQVEAAENLCRTSEMSKCGTLEIHVHPGQAGFDAALRARGFSWYNSMIELSRELDDLPDLPDLGSYVKVERWKDEHVAASRRLLNRLLADESESSAISRSQWREQCKNVEPKWSHVLVDYSGDRPNVRGFVLASVAPGSNGEPAGVIDMVVVADSADSSAHFHSLTLATMISQKSAGAKVTTVTVNEPGDPFTTRLYRNLGFEDSYEIRSFTAGF